MDKLALAFQFLINNKRIFGAAAGLLFGILYLFFGFWKTLVFAFFVFAGYMVGRLWDETEDWRDVIERLVPPKYRE